MADEITDPAREMADLIDFLVGLNAVTPHGHQAPQSWQVLSNGLHIEPTSAEFLELLAAIRSRLARLHEFVSKLDNPTVTHDVKQHIYQAVARFAQTFNPTNFTIQWPQILTSCVVAADATTFRMFSPVMVQYQPLKRLADGDREEALNGVRQAIADIQDADDLDAWARSALIQGYQRIELILKYFQFFGHEGLAREVALTSAVTRVAAGKLDSKSSTLKNVWAALVLVAKIVEVVSAPSVGYHAISDYTNYTQMLIAGSSKPEETLLLAPPDKCDDLVDSEPVTKA